jgi:hypothetical protein
MALDLVLIFLLLLALVKMTRLTAPFVPTRKKDFERLLGLVKKYDIKNFVDLGCGAGGVLAKLSRTFPDRKFTGIEFSAWSYLFCAARFLFSKNVKIKWGNFFWYGWKNYDAVYLFWINTTISKARQKMENKLHSGQLVISYCFEADWLRDKLVEKNQEDGKMIIYVYKI